MSAGNASTLEQRALRTSIWVSIGFAVVSVVWGLLVIPVNLFRRSIRDLQTARPEPELAARVERFAPWRRPRQCQYQPWPV